MAQCHPKYIKLEVNNPHPQVTTLFYTVSLFGRSQICLIIEWSTRLFHLILVGHGMHLDNYLQFCLRAHFSRKMRYDPSQ